MHILTLPAHAPKHSRCPLALKPLRRPLLQALALLGLGLGSIDDAQAATITWNNATANWNAGASWVGGLAPTGTSLTDELVFGGSSAYTATNNFTTGTALPAFYLNRMTFTNTANVTVNATGTYPANIPLRFGGSSPQMTFSGAGTKAFVNSINLGSGQSLSATIASGSGQVTFGQNTGAVGSPLIGTGTMTITNNSATTAQIFTFSQNFQGTLNLAGGNFKTSDLGGALFGLHMTLDVAAGATFDFANEEEDLGAITGGGTVKLGTLSFRTDRFFAEGDHLFSGSFQGSGSITARAGLAGSGTTTWSGNNSFAGAFALENGTLKLADGGRISGATSFTISNGATVLIDDSTQSTDIVRTNVNPTALAGNYTWLGRDNAARAETLGAVTIQTSAAS